MHFELRQGLCLFTGALLLCVNRQAVAQPGKLDTTFGKKGVFATTNNQTTANAVAIQGDGKIVIARTGPSSGQPSNTLIRLSTNGTLDTSFGAGGVVSIVNREAVLHLRVFRSRDSTRRQDSSGFRSGNPAIVQRYASGAG